MTDTYILLLKASPRIMASFMYTIILFLIAVKYAMQFTSKNCNVVNYMDSR